MFKNCGLHVELFKSETLGQVSAGRGCCPLIKDYFCPRQSILLKDAESQMSPDGRPAPAL